MDRKKIMKCNRKERKKKGKRKGGESVFHRNSHLGQQPQQPDLSNFKAWEKVLPASSSCV